MVVTITTDVTHTRVLEQLDELANATAVTEVVDLPAVTYNQPD